MKFDNREVHTIKIALVNRIYQLDQLIIQEEVKTPNKAILDFLKKERKENIDLIKYIEG